MNTVRRPALVLGATSDIGAAVARRFAEAGYPLQLAGRDLGALEGIATDLNLRCNVPVTVHAFDALAPETFPGFFDALPTLPGIVVCAVGVLGEQATTERTPAEARRITDSNFLGVALALEEVAARLVALPEPTAIIAFSSVAGDRGRAKNYWYGAAKAALTTLLSGLRQKYARTQLKIITVKPGFVRTRMTAGLDLLPALTDTPEAIAALVWRGLARGRRIITPPKWLLIMTIIRLLPERVFERLRF